MIFVLIILEYIYDWYEVFFGVGNYLKYKVVEIRNNFVFMIIVKFKYCIYV